MSVNSVKNMKEEIDDLIYPIILLLNKKGYITQFCCEGHVKTNNKNKCCYDNCYISFDEDKLPVVLPKDFILEDDDYYNENCISSEKAKRKITIRKLYKKRRISW